MSDHPVLSIQDACTCDFRLFPEWSTLPFSAFDKQHSCPDRMTEFRTKLFYSGTGKLFLRFTGGCRFRLLINGKFAEDGPVEVGGDYGKTDAPYWWFYDEKEISSFLHSGENELLFQMIPAGMAQTDYSLGFLWVWCAVQRNDKWQIIPAEQWQFRINPFYQRKNSQDFSQRENAWEEHCTCVRVPVPVRWLGLPALTSIPRKDYCLRFPFGKSENVRQCGKKVRIRSGNPAVFYLEFPEERVGHFEVSWNGCHQTILALEFQELYGVPSRDGEYRILLSGESGTCRTIRCCAFRYVRIAVTPSFFTSENSGLTVTLSFRMFERHFPVKKKNNLCSVPSAVRKIDALCLRNVVMCMQRMHWDSPVHQEGLGCTGDYRIEALAEYAAFGESRLARADLIRTALLLRQQGKMFHTSYELCYILMFHEYLLYTGDISLLSEYRDVLKGIYARFRSFTGPSGLLSEAENYLFIDWIVDGKYTYHHPPASRGTGVMTALWYGALRALITMAEQLGREEEAHRFKTEAEQVRLSFNRELWNPEKRCYRDGVPGLSSQKVNRWLPAEDGQETCSSLTSIMALAYGLPTEEQEPEQLLKRAVSGGLELRPTVYYMFYLFEAVERYGKWAEYGPELVKQWNVFRRTGLRESWVSGDYSHGWGAAPSIFLRKHFLLKQETVHD